MLKLDWSKIGIIYHFFITFSLIFKNPDADKLHVVK